MATIVKRNNKHCVVYSYVAADGSTKQKWETYDTVLEAKRRKTEIEYEKQKGTFFVPTTHTVAELLKEYCEIYGVSNWAMSTYKGKVGLMNNYIIPLIGDYKLDEITPRMMDNFYLKLQKVKPVVVNNKVPKQEFLTASTIREIHKLLRSAFTQAVKWELMQRNPVLNATLPKEQRHSREIWTVETLLHALEVCEDDILSLAINLSFSCSLRIGEMLGLTWDCITIDDESIRENNAQMVLPKVISVTVLSEILESAYLKLNTSNHSDCYYRYAIRDIAVMELLFASGVRVYELCNLKISDVDLKNKFIKVYGKGSKERYIQLTNKDVVSALKRYQKEYLTEIKATGFYFINNRGDKLSEQSVRFMVKKYAETVNPELHITPHMFRHTIATLLLEEDVDIRYIQEFLGHSSITTTQIYTHISQNAQKKIFTKKHPRNKIKVNVDR